MNRNGTIAQAKGHTYSEAFMLMWYACKQCAHRERIWNSRDGVTPFGCDCPSCGGIMNHIEWGLDEFAPEYKPRPKQRFWRDGTPDEAEAIMRHRIKSIRDKYPLTPEQEAHLIQKTRDGSDESEFRKGWPALDIAP